MSKSLVKKALELCKDDDDFQVDKISKRSKSIKKKSSDDGFRLKGKVSKSLVEKYSDKKIKKANLLEKNLAYLKKISKPVVKYDLIEPALNSKRKQKKEIRKEEESVFTEEDFKNFEKSYF
ncbi:unnamed protein product [Brachionus calyciflorus]|uniref:Active regulator of SIRT1 n=1 Tax=Brachionus calyciflorus TaxID=104777 RepID=A0A814A533_9BILA|nr:unnamed protein product [Brachionus calyciflorus]